MSKFRHTTLFNQSRHKQCCRYRPRLSCTSWMTAARSRLQRALLRSLLGLPAERAVDVQERTSGILEQELLYNLASILYDVPARRVPMGCRRVVCEGSQSAEKGE